MANKKITDFTVLTAPASGDLVETVDVSDTTDSAQGSSRAVTHANIITKAHGLSDGFQQVASGVMTSKNAADTRTDLGLVIGTNVQAFDQDLTDLAGLSGVEGDIIYRNATQWQRLPKGTALQQLRVNAGATAPEWATISGGGQTLVTHIVAASGGTHTSLTAALAAASNGDTIYVREGTYTEAGAISSALTDITIIGENRSSAIIAMGANNFTLSGTKVTVRGLSITSTTGAVSLSGANAALIDCNLLTSGNVTMLTMGGVDYIVAHCLIASTNVSTQTAGVVIFSGNNGLVSVNHFSVPTRQGSLTTGAIRVNGDNMGFTDNRVASASDTSTSCLVSCTGNWCSINDNKLNTGNVSTLARNIYSGGDYNTIDGNTIYNGIVGIASAASASITANNIRVGGTTPTGIICGSDYCLAEGNIISASGGTGISVTGGNANKAVGNTIRAASTGIDILTGNNYSDVSNNTIYSAVTTPIADASTNTNIVNNVGASALFEKRMVRMKNTSGGALALGDVVVMKAVAAGDEVTTTTTASDNAVFGMATGAISDTAYGLFQVSGKTTNLKVDGTTDIAVGDFISTFTTAKIGQKATVGTLGTTPGHQAIAVALEAYTTNDSAGVIDALIINPRRL